MPRLRLSGFRPGLAPSLLTAAASGAALTLALPPIDLGPVAFVALAPVLWAVRGSRARRGALLGLVFGLAYFGILMSWLVPVTALGWSVLVIGQSAWMALLFAYASLVWRDEAPVRTAIAFGAAWAAVEWLRGAWPLGGFTWGGLGYSQHDFPLLLPLASVAGVWGISLVVATVNALVVAAAVGEGRSGVRGAAVAIALVALPVTIPVPAPEGPRTDVAVVQGNVPKFVAVESRIIEDRIVAENHAGLHRRLAPNPPDLAVWPENAIDRDPARAPDLRPLVEGAVRAGGAHTLIGAVTDAADGRLRNENLLYSPDARVLSRYAKNHLVPYGEYVPFRRWLGFIEAIRQVPHDLQPGTGLGMFDLPGRRFASVICFENAFPDLVRRYVAEDAAFLVVSTNNATFLRSAASAQHLVMSELRAVENARWVVHAAISGISAVVDHRGRVLGRTELFEPAILRADVPAGESRTAFSRIGGWLPAAFFLGALMFPARRRRRGRGRASPPPSEPRVAVVLPTYDERETIEGVLGRVLDVGGRVDAIVVDDSSPDGTGEVVRKLAEREERVTLIERPAKGGLASAYLEGFRRALAEGYDLVVEMDADLSHRPEDLPRLLEAASRHDLVIGSRYVRGGAIRNWGALRRALSRTGNLYAGVVLGLPVADATSGYRVFRRAALEELLERGVTADGYAFQVELAYSAWRAGLSVGETPITFEERRAGRSKLSRAIVVEALWRVLLWGVRDRLLRGRRHPPGPRRGLDAHPREGVQ